MDIKIGTYSANGKVIFFQICSKHKKIFYLREDKILLQKIYKSILFAILIVIKSTLYYFLIHISFKLKKRAPFDFLKHI
jgi:hypothetical protein